MLEASAVGFRVCSMIVILVSAGGRHAFSPPRPTALTEHFSVFENLCNSDFDPNDAGL